MWVHVTPFLSVGKVSIPAPIGRSHRRTGWWWSSLVWSYRSVKAHWRSL